MKTTVYLLLLLASILVAPLGTAEAAMAVWPTPQTAVQRPVVSKKTIKKAKKGRTWLGKFKLKIARQLEKWGRPFPSLDVHNYLVLCLLLLLASILFFALNSVTGIAWLFNLFGSVAGIAAMVFFVLWLLDISGNL